jgi:MFS family permease
MLIVAVCGARSPGAGLRLVSVAPSVDAASRPGDRLRIALGVLALQLPFGLVFAWGAVAPHALADGWPPVLVGAVFSATPLGYGTGTLLGGWLGDRVRPRGLGWAGLALLALGFAAAFARPSGATFVACYGFLALGVGGGLALTGAVAALSQAFPGRRGAAAGAATATYAASAIVQAPIVGTLIPGLGWVGALAAVGTATALVAIAGLAAVPPLPAPGARRGPSPRGGAKLLARPLLWSGFLVVFAGSTFGTSAAVDVGVAARALGFGAAVGTAGVVLVAAGNASARLAAGWASDRLGVDRPMAVVLGLDLAGALLLFWPLSSVGFLAGALAGGLGLGAAGLVGRIAAEAAPDAPSSAFGLVFAGYTLAALGGPLAAAAAGLPVAWLVVAAPALGGAAILAVRPRFRRARGSPP